MQQRIYMLYGISEGRPVLEAQVTVTTLTSREFNFEGLILAVDTAAARRCARLHVPDPRAERD
jgi:hypothetical protein